MKEEPIESRYAELMRQSVAASVDPNHAPLVLVAGHGWVPFNMLSEDQQKEWLAAAGLLDEFNSLEL